MEHVKVSRQTDTLFEIVKDSRLAICNVVCTVVKRHSQPTEVSKYHTAVTWRVKQFKILRNLSNCTGRNVAEGVAYSNTEFSTSDLVFDKYCRFFRNTTAL